LEHTPAYSGKTQRNANREWSMMWKMMALLALALFLGGCRHTPDETRVREAIAAMASAAEAGKAGEATESLSDDFDGNGGALDKKSLANMIRLVHLRGAHIGVTMGSIDVERRGERFVASFTVTLTSASNLLPDQLGVFKVESGWRKEGGEWHCYAATWEKSL
jgi:hypothetical protein